MTTYYSITIPAKKIILLSSDNARLTKLTQLLISRYFVYTISPWNFPKPVGRHPHVDLCRFVYNVLEAEDEMIERIRKERTNEEFHRRMLESTREFFDILMPNDAGVDLMMSTEIKELKKYQEVCQQHKAAIFQILFDLDYSQPLDQVRQQFRQIVADMPGETYDVYKKINVELLKV